MREERRNYLIHSIVLTFVVVTSLLAQTTLRIMTYNLLFYDGQDRNTYFNTVVEDIDPDLLVVQEMLTPSAAETFKTDALNNEYHTIDYHDGFDMDSHVYYNPFVLKFVSANYIETNLRDIAEYKFEIPATDQVFWIYSLHLKAGSDDDDALMRFREASKLRDHLNEHPSGTPFIVAGDFNVYNAYENAYQELIESQDDNDGRLFDPIDRAGYWHNNANDADIHTQSTRTTYFGDGSTGGMDDRFDLILVSESLLDNVQNGSYTAYGNDGNHFNLAINSGTNSAVSREVANALHQASDHLPVVCEITFSPNALHESEETRPPGQSHLFQNFPNPFNPVTSIRYIVSESDFVQLSIYNLNGQKIRTLVNRKQAAGEYTQKWDGADDRGRPVSSGIYFYELRTSQSGQRQKMILMR
ncbi:MAG: T9SS type A sorting domain-containing protein [Caldithrix sp.]|nr:T9SS type A sorting domain-containing protein [Caldithrix sp.]